MTVKDYGIRINQFNYFCDNLTYHVQKVGHENIDLRTNCWCEGDSALIAVKIYDGYDDVTLGLIDFLPMATAPFGCDTTIYVSTDQPEAASSTSLECFPNPATSRMKVRFQTEARAEYLKLILM